MSKGSRIVPIRIPAELESRILIAIDVRNKHSSEEPFSMSEWIRKAIMEKLDHLERSKKKKPKA